MAETISGDLLGNFETRAHELPWVEGRKGRVVSGTEGSVLAYGGEEKNICAIYDDPKKFAVYRSSGDIIGHTDDIVDDGLHGVIVEKPTRRLFDRKKKVNKPEGLCKPHPPRPELTQETAWKKDMADKLMRKA